MKTNEQNKGPGQEKFTTISPAVGGDQKNPVDEPTRKAGEQHPDKAKA